jgi:hypothetical protein
MLRRGNLIFGEKQDFPPKIAAFPFDSSPRPALRCDQGTTVIPL